MNQIFNPISYLESLGDQDAATTWETLKANDTSLAVSILVNEVNEEFLPQTFSSIIKDKFSEMYPPATSYLEIFKDAKAIEKKLKEILRVYEVGKDISSEDKRFLGELFSRSILLQTAVKKNGAIVDIVIGTKQGYWYKFFAVRFSNGREQTISIRNYVNPAFKPLFNIWEKLIV